MRTESTVKPEKNYEIVNFGRLSEVSLFENVREIRENGETHYEWDEYRIKVGSRESLEESVKRNTGLWLARAKEEKYKKAAEKVRRRRDGLLRDTDFRFTVDRLAANNPPAGETEADFRALTNVNGEWAKYRQALRDIPEQPGFPFDVVFPEMPRSSK